MLMLNICSLDILNFENCCSFHKVIQTFELLIFLIKEITHGLQTAVAKQVCPLGNEHLLLYD